MVQSYFIHQTQAKSNTTKLVLAYAIGLFVVPLLINFLVMLGLFTDGQKTADAMSHLQLYLITIVFCSIPTLCGSLIFYFKYSGAGYKIAESLGAHPIDDYEDNFNLTQLRNVVDEISFASGIPAPKIYILEDPTINAFAAGNTIQNSIICVNTGTLDNLKRDELSGVIAHEFSHIVNRDVNINLKIGMLIAGFSALTIVGYSILRLLGGTSSSSSRHSNGRNGGSATAYILAVGVTLLVLGYLWKFYSMIISAAVSRQREYLADATAVSYTRDDSIVRALIKIKTSTKKSTIAKSHQETFNHLFFSSEKKKSIFDSHPPLEERIKRASEMSFSKFGTNTNNQQNQ